MRSAGFGLEEHVTQDMDAIKQRYGVPAGLDSCHTALIGGYVIEGHVPATDVQRLLAEQPDVVGLTAPGMPMGSPGMESDRPSPPYTVFSLKADGSVAAFARHP
ncbi:MAG: putative metal-binding protein [Phormidesmis priestleyi Ana]|uniref:Putative metal-binding protein n=1 Tax=Phormidesmis priestleyi Ana TaxID=1666911 RepID=A0A0P7ZKX8_9CYAN|nr:MAG: putative metal-binding protein [Phormidesmis priestleyi Ana]